MQVEVVKSGLELKPRYIPSIGDFFSYTYKEGARIYLLVQGEDTILAVDIVMMKAFKFPVPAYHDKFVKYELVDGSLKLKIVE